MPQYEISVPGKGTFRVNSPTPLTDLQAWQAVQEQLNAPEPQAAGFSLKDTARVAQQSLYGGLQTLTDLFGAGNVASKGLTELQQEAASKLSEERKAEIARRELLKKQAEGDTLKEIQATVGGFTEAPFQTAVGALFGSAPVIASAFIPGGQPAAAAGLTGRAALGARALAAAKSPAAGVGALMGVGGQKGQDYEAVKQALLEKNFSEADAERLAQEVSGYSLENAPRQLASGLVGGLEGVSGIERLLGRAGRLGKMAPADKAVGLPEPTYGQALRKNILGEAAPEALQAATGQVGTNIALNQAGIPTDLMQGVAAQAITDALIGGTLGAATSPLKMREMRQEFVNDEIARKREEDAKVAEGIKQAAAQRQKTKEQIVGDQPLMLPAPSKELEPTKEVAPLQNPIGNLTPDELGPEVTSYLNQYRKDNGLPRLKTYSIEDVKDAMTAINPEGEKAALDSILAAKTGYTGQQTITAKDVENAAIEKNVATGTKGFNDFLARTTGVNSLDQMSEPQLYAAFKALADMPANTTGQQIVLPEGTNASRFTQQQYNDAVQSVNGTLSLNTALQQVKQATGLKTDRDAQAILDAAIKSEDLTQSKQVVYNTYQPKSGKLVGTYPTRQAADSAAKGKLNVQEQTVQQVAPKAPVTPPKAPRAGLPAGYDITERQFKEGEEPEGYQITSTEGGKPFPTVLNQADVQSKIDQLSTDRREIADNKLQEVLKYEQVVETGKRELEKMEAAGNFDTDEYKKKKAQQAAKEDLLLKRIDALYKEITSLTAPLKAKPVGKKAIARKGFTVTRDGKEAGTFPSREAAEESILAGLSDEALDALVSDKKFGGLANRAAAEQNRRRSAPPTKGKKVSEVLKDLESGPPVKETPELLAKTKPLRDMLNRFGLGDVALKLVKAIENKADGSYAGKVIELALDAKFPIRTLRHESLHALKELGFFTDAQWKALEKMARDKWVKKYLEGSTAVLQDGTTGTRLQAYKEMGLTEADILEEAIADAFGDFDANQAPPGMLTALLNKMRGFFESLNNYLDDLGFQNSQDIFGAIEKGQLKAGQAQAGGKKLSLIRPAVEGETEISTQNPQGVKRTNDPITDMLSIDEASVREAMKANPDMYKRTVQAIKGYGFVPLNTPNNQVIELFKRNIVNNLLFLHDQVPEDIRERSKLWYDGANRIATDMGKQFGVSMEQVAGIMAAMSPQKDWFQNVSMAERALDILTEQKNKAWDDNMLKYAQSYVNEASSRKEREKRQAAFDQIKRVAKAGTTLSKMNLDDAAAFIRAYDEAFNSRQYRIVTPEGGFGDLVTNNDGTPSTMMWSTYDPIKKTVSIFRDGSRKNISEQLGEEHKIRSFYNNIAAPNSDIGHVTIDTHAVAAGLFEALAGTDKEVTDNFGGTGKSNILGVGGTYGIIADAYREAASRKGLKAREMQSITWEAVRGLFGEDIKSTIKPKVRAEWTKYREGKQSFNETREKIIDIAGGIDNPDWVGGDAGTFVSNGGTSYDKAFKPAGGVRLREEKDIREKLTFNLSAVTNSIPGLRELYARAMSRDKDAYRVLQNVAESNLKFLLSGTNAKVNVENAKGVYMADREPSIAVSVSFNERDMANVMASLAKFADSYNQQQIHVRQETAQRFGHEFGDGSYATAVYEIGLKKQLNDNQISRVIDESGLQGFTITDNKLIAYFVKAGGDEQANFKSFKERIQRVNELVGDGTSRPKQTIERLYVYGEGDGARIPYRDVAYPESDIRTKQASDTATPRIIAEYLNKAPVTTFKQKPLSAAQVKEQQKLMRAFEAMPVNDLKNPLVKRAYNALANALKEQFKVIPIKVELMESTDEPYANSDAVRRDVSLNNRFKVYATSPETFGPPGSNFKGHPLLKDSGLKDVNGKPMLYNDLLRAVHDYFAHNLTETQFGPNGEAAAWRNHMAMTQDPFARWALTSETRAQNAWQNFRPGVESLNLIQRGFADQKAALPPLEFVMTGDAKVDEPVTELKELLTPEQQRGSAPAKYSLREAPDTPAFKRWFGDSKVVDAKGKPMVVYHGSTAEITQFDSKFSNDEGFFFSNDATDADNYGGKVVAAYLSLQNPYVVSWSQFSEELNGNPDLSPWAIGKTELQNRGYDGFIVKADKQSKQYSQKYDEQEYGYDQYVAFDPTQVKSATGNIGTFDATNPDIRYSLREAPDTPEFKRFFGRSGFINSAGAPMTMYHATDADITEFRSSEDGKLGAGIYMSSVPKYVTQYAPEGNVMPLYASAQNPFILNINGDSVKTLSETRRAYGMGIGQQMEAAVTLLTDGKKRLKDLTGQQVQNLFKRNGYDGILARDDAGNIIEATVFKPEQVKSATGNVGTYSPKSKDIRYSLRDATDMFAGKELDRASKTEYKGRYKLVNMDIDDFLRLSKIAGQDAGAQSRADERVQAGTPFTSVPHLYVDPEGTDLRVTGHDGRHRARALKKAGYDTMPVELRSMIRWSEQTDPESSDYKENWPERIYAEEGALREGASIEMPVTREQSPLNYQAPAKKLSVRSVEDEIKAMPNGDKIHQAVAGKTTAREEKSIARRILDAFAGDSIAALRQQALNRYNQLSVYDKRLAEKMGGKELLADSSAEAAALLSDTASGVAAAAFGVNNVGGAPVYRNGVTVVDNFNGEVKGLMDILMPLAELKDPFAYRAFQFYAASKRGSRFEADGKEKLFDQDDFAYAAQLESKYKVFKQVHADWIKYNDKLVDYMVSTSIISKGKAAEFTKYADYIPFYRQLEGEQTIGPKVFQSISGVKAPKKLKGDTDAPLADFMETIVRNTQSIIQAGMKNTAGQKAVDVALALGDAELLDKQSSAPGTVTIMRDGEYKSYAVADELFINSVKSLNMPDVKLWGIFAGPANLLRNMVTKDPGFMLANLLRDSMSAYVTSGVKMTPVADTVANFGRAIGGTDPTYQALVKAGILGGYDYAQGVEKSGAQLAADLRKRTGNQSLSEKALDGFGLWSTLEKGTSASDAATRMAVYNRVLKDTGNEAEAIFRALEVMNFNRKGASPIVRLLTAAIPFLNARMQGLDVFYRAGIQPFLDKNPTDRAKAVQKAFFVRGMYLTSLSIAYWAMTHDDDDYLAQEQETRDNNWLIPSLGVKIPIPFEVGVLFKVIPERIMGYTMGDDTGKDFAESMGRAAWSTFGFLPVPQTALPLLEAATNYSFYTGRNIVGAGMEGVVPEFQKGPNTSKVASFLGEQLGASPMKIDHIIKGYTGTIGTYMVDLMDSIGDLNSESPKAAKRFEQLPVWKRFSLDPEAKGTVTAYYKLKDAVDETVRTINLLERTGKFEELTAYGQENAKLFSTRHYISAMEKQMKTMREAALQINNSSMSAEEKREALSAVNQAQINMTRHIQGLKKMLAE